MNTRLSQVAALVVIAAFSLQCQVRDSAATRAGEFGGGNSTRSTTAIVYSVFVPGAGQSMLGNTTKGAAFTLAFVGSALTAIISHNNYVARGERLDALEFQYKYASTWQTADFIYRGMEAAHDQLKSDRQRRDIFLAVAVVVWAANIADVVFNTEDKGQSMFSLLQPSGGTNALCRITMDPTNQSLISVSIPLP
jgi:hypothetical protein